VRLKDKVAIVAGAAWGGIGAATALRFAQEGAKLVVSTRQREGKLAETVERIEAVGGEAVPVMGDVADDEAWHNLVATAVDRFGKVTTLVHNASGGYRGGRRVIDYAPEELESGLAVTLGGPWRGAKHCIPEMIRAGGGAIVLISTVNATITNPLFGIYSAAKAGVNALARSIALA
jgi:NAD(P)-dependent dehydrogenase (short-subunit alcohol dehydrogenase family)